MKAMYGDQNSDDFILKSIVGSSGQDRINFNQTMDTTSFEIGPSPRGPNTNVDSSYKDKKK